MKLVFILAKICTYICAQARAPTLTHIYNNELTLCKGDEFSRIVLRVEFALGLSAYQFYLYDRVVSFV